MQGKEKGGRRREKGEGRREDRGKEERGGARVLGVGSYGRRKEIDR